MTTTNTPKQAYDITFREELTSRLLQALVSNVKKGPVVELDKMVDTAIGIADYTIMRLEETE